MARIFRVMTYVGREGGTAMLRWQMTQAWSEAMEWDTEVDCRCVQQPVQDVAFVMRGLTDSLGQIASGQEIHHSGSGWVQGVVIMHVEVAKDDGGAM